MIHEIEIKTALNHVKGKFPYNWDLNIYRGCGHRCEYCFAQYSHKYLESEFFNDIFVKKNISCKLEYEFSRKSWRHEVVNVGGVTDSYQPIEKKYELMKQILPVFVKHRNPLNISTKSDLILRDFDILDKLSKKAPVNIAASIICLDETIRKKIEPGSSTAVERFAMLRKFKTTNATIGLHLMPVLPYITDGSENLEKIFKIASEIKIDYIIVGALGLRGKTKTHFMQFLQNKFPAYYRKYQVLYSGKNELKLYRSNKYKEINSLLKKYKLNQDYRSVLNNKKAQFLNVSKSGGKTLDDYFT